MTDDECHVDRWTPDRGYGADVTALVARYRHVAIAIANKRAWKVPGTWRGDLRSAALEGLLEAAQRYDPGQGAQFMTFASYRVVGAVEDEIRRLYTGRRQPTLGTRAKDRTHDTTIDLTVPEQAHASVAADADPAEIVDLETTSRLCTALIWRLTPTDRHIAYWYFVDGLNLAEIADRVGVTPSRICQRMTRIKKTLRRLAVRSELLAA